MVETSLCVEPVGKAESRPWIAYIAPFRFPEGGAGARRILGNAQALVSAGYEVRVVSAQVAQGEHSVQCVFPGISVVSTGERDAEHLPMALKRARYATMGSRTRAWIAAAPVPPAAVVLYSGYSPYLLQLTGLCRRLKIPLIFEAVEWYTARNFWGFIASPYLWNTEFAMRVLIPRLDGIIGISTYLARYYRSRGLPVVQVPPTLDTVGVSPRIEQEESREPRLRLVYCGSASYDLLNTVIAALLRLDPAGARILLEIAGPHRSDVLTLPALRGFGHLPPGLVVHGRVSHEASLGLVRAADFSIFLRTINRISKAGFPTKFGESLSVGTPVITNLTSDLHEVLRDGENGLVCETPEVSSLVPVLERALALTPQALQAMRAAARTTAENRFDYRLYAADLARFLTTCGATPPHSSL